jgi:hypothetical protein
VTSFSVRKVVVEAEPKWKKGHLPGKWAPFTDAQDTFPALLFIFACFVVFTSHDR